MAKKTKRMSLDVPMAAFVAGAVGFVAYAMPDPIFTGIVVSRGLPDLLAAAQPPLGATARAGVIGTAVFATFVLVWALLRALSGRPRRPAVAAVDDLPRLRRADAHPDAPARRPIVAGAELGEPYSPVGEVDPQFEPEPDWNALAAIADDGPIEAPATVQAPAPDAEPEWEWEGPRFHAEAAPVAAASDDDEDASIDALARRFEAGLVRRRQVRRGRDIDAPMPGFTAAIDPRLQSALDDLQRLANRPS